MRRDALTLDLGGGLQARLDVLRFGPPSGPYALITAGIHGGEFTGVDVALRLVDSLEAAESGNRLAAGVVVVPVCNPPAFRLQRRTSPYDELDMNRIFPGDPAGAPTQRLAAAVWELARGAHWIVDLHCCGRFGSPYTLALHQEDAAARALAAQVDLPLVVQSHGTRGQLFIEACAAGIPAVILELPGGDGFTDEAAAARAHGALVNLLVLRGWLAGEGRGPRPAWAGRLQELAAPAEGRFRPAVPPGTFVPAGEPLGWLEDAPVPAPGDVWAVRVRPAGYVFAGFTLASLAPPADPGGAAGP